MGILVNISPLNCRFQWPFVFAALDIRSQTEKSSDEIDISKAGRIGEKRSVREYLEEDYE